MRGNTSFSGELRKLIVNTVSRDPVMFNEAFLGRSNKEYCEWISNPERWGGMYEGNWFRERGVDMKITFTDTVLPPYHFNKSCPIFSSEILFSETEAASDLWCHM